MHWLICNDHNLFKTLTWKICLQGSFRPGKVMEFDIGLGKHKVFSETCNLASKIVNVHKLLCSN